jgi:hypothetical protein
MTEWKEIERKLIPGRITVVPSDSRHTVDYIACHYAVIERRGLPGEGAEIRRREVQGPAIYIYDHPGLQPLFEIANTVIYELLRYGSKLEREA